MNFQKFLEFAFKDWVRIGWRKFSANCYFIPSQNQNIKSNIFTNKKGKSPSASYEQRKQCLYPPWQTFQNEPRLSHWPGSRSLWSRTGNKILHLWFNSITLYYLIDHMGLMILLVHRCPWKLLWSHPGKRNKS